VTHLKATTFPPQDNADKRAAEASAISNFFVTVYLTTNASHPYVLCGDMNEDVFRPETNQYTTGEPIQRMTGPYTGLQLTTPVNPVTGSDLTESIQTSLNVRFDYILPNALLFSNMASSQVFRTDLLTNPPPPLLTSDDKTASDHLPVEMFFNNPYDKPFNFKSFNVTNQTVTMTWDSVLGQPYRVEYSTNLNTWTILASGLVAEGPAFTFTTNVSTSSEFFRVYRIP
jgi:hypothetical protein